MQHAEKISISLPAEMIEAIRARVTSGAYGSTSEVIRAALRSWQREEVEHEERISLIRARIRRSIDDPRPSLTMSEVRATLARLHADTQAAERDADL